MNKFSLLLGLFMLGAPAMATTIAYDGKTMATDSQITFGDCKLRTDEKVIQINCFTVGCSGRWIDIKNFKKWFCDPLHESKPPLKSMTALVAYSGGAYEYDESYIPHKVQAPYAIGSGAKVAMAAMRAGASARRAIEIACELDLYTSGPVYEFQLVNAHVPENKRRPN